MRNILLKCKSYFFYAGIFSFIINLLSLTPILFIINVMDRVLSSRSLETLLMMFILAVFALIMSSFLEILNKKFLSRLSFTLNRTLSLPILMVILEKKLNNQHVKNAMNDINNLESFISNKGANALFNLPWIPIYLFILYLLHPLLVLLALIAVVILVILAIWEYKTTHFNQLAQTAHRIGANNVLDKAIENNEIINALSLHERIALRWWKLNREYLNLSQKVVYKISTIKGLTQLVQVGLRVCAVATGAYLVLNYNVSAGIMIGAMLLMGKTIAPITSVIVAAQDFIDAKAAYQRIDDLLAKQTTKDTKLTLPPPQGNLTVQNLFFFMNQDRNILSNVSFSITSGDCLGIVGASASGKTTLARLLVGYYKPKDGFVRLEGADVSQWSANGLGHMIGYLPQNIQLFSGTIAENIARLGNVADNEEKIIDAAKKVGIHKMILNLSKGYDTNIGENCEILSGGQKQLLGLARALFGNPSYMVLDEPNSNLDGEAELHLIKLLAQLKSEKVSVVLITHKPNLIEITDKLLALHKGNVVQFGDTQKVLKDLQVI